MRWRPRRESQLCHCTSSYRVTGGKFLDVPGRRWREELPHREIWNPIYQVPAPSSIGLSPTCLVYGEVKFTAFGIPQIWVCTQTVTYYSCDLGQISYLFAPLFCHLLIAHWATMRIKWSNIKNLAMYYLFPSISSATSSLAPTSYYSSLATPTRSFMYLFFKFLF